MDRETILDLLHKNKDTIKGFGVSSLVLFGSYARNEQTKESDIDFLVEFRPEKYSIDNHLGLLYFLEELFNKKIDLVKKHMVREELKEEIFGGSLYAAKI